MYYSTHRLILDRDGDPTVELDCAWNRAAGEAGSLSIADGWELDSITATDADSGRVLDLDETELEMVRRACEPTL